MDFEMLKNVPDVLDVWEKLVASEPEETIIVSDTTMHRFSRKAIDIMSGKVRAWLESRSVGKDDMVLICLPRGAVAIATMLGVWKAGAAFTVVENQYPKERIEFIKKDSKCKVVIDSQTAADIRLVEYKPGHVKADIHDLAFAIYTSGSTGNPKGVLHEYGTLKMNTIGGIGQNKYTLDKTMRLAHVAPFSFVASIKIALLTFMTGMVMYVLPYDVIKNPIKLKKYFVDNEITYAFLPPSLLRLSRGDFGPYLRVVVTGSEPAGGIEPKDTVIINTYSMSESAFTITEFVIDKKYDICPVGKPNFDGLGLKLLDEEGREVVSGEEGEICFENPFFRGYIGLEEETKQAKRGGIYHSGDIGRFDENGDLVLVGRTNDMVKINGNRVEPSEIENIVKKYLDVDQCIVKGFVDAYRTYLCLYYTGGSDIEPADIREVISEHMPYYMMPSYMIKMDNIPLLPNGKTDKRSLKPPKPGSAEAYAPPRNDTEKILCEAMAKVLGRDKVGIYDDFYELGGDSLSAMDFLAAVGIEDINAMDVFNGRNVESIAGIYEKNKKNRSESDPVTYEMKARTEALPLTVMQLDMFDRQLYSPKETMYNLHQTVVGKDPEDAPKILEALKKVIKNHPVFSIGLEFGEDDLPVQRYDEKYTPVVEIEEMTEEQMKKERVSMVGLHPLMKHGLFEVRLIRTEKHVYLFFNPHHIIIDGMGYQALVDSFARAYRGEELLMDTFFSCLAKDRDVRHTQKYLDDIEFYENLYGDKDWCRIIPPDLKSTDNLLSVIPAPKQVSIPDAVRFEKTSSLSRGSLFSLATLMTIAEISGKKDVMIAWVFHDRTDVMRMRAVGILVKVLPIGISFDSYDTMSELYDEVRTQTTMGIEHSSYQYTEEKDNAFESDTTMVAFETATITDESSFSDLGLSRAKDTEAALSTNKAAPNNFALMVYEMPDMIQPMIVYAKSLYSEELIDRFADVYAEYLDKLLAVDDPDSTKVADILMLSDDEGSKDDITPGTKVKAIASKYPWIVDEIGDAFPETRNYIDNPIARKVVMGMTLEAVSKQSKRSFEDIKQTLEKLIAKH